jgi:2-polyprenyl-3-methyl-5-hydroxy-6-metoxy-1,4-benzoquinol methylase
MLSFPENIPIIIDIVNDLKPKRILDVGGGMGKYALLIKENNLSKQAEAGDMSPNPSITIDCCEDNPYFYQQKFHLGLYDKHYHKSIFEMPTTNDYDLILFIDVVEHWEKDITKELLKKLKGKKLISTPKKVGMYEEHFYGDSRHHITQWNKDDFNVLENRSNHLSHIFII